MTSTNFKEGVEKIKADYENLLKKYAQES